MCLGDFEPSPEMLSRTRPNLFDLFVAVLAGFAGAYALVDEKISPALPGVAIATAIVPPLANSGLCLALGEVNAGIGSFLLFFCQFCFDTDSRFCHFSAKRYGEALWRSSKTHRLCTSLRIALNSVCPDRGFSGSLHGHNHPGTPLMMTVSNWPSAA